MKRKGHFGKGIAEEVNPFVDGEPSPHQLAILVAIMGSTDMATLGKELAEKGSLQDRFRLARHLFRAAVEHLRTEPVREREEAWRELARELYQHMPKTNNLGEYVYTFEELMRVIEAPQGKRKRGMTSFGLPTTRTGLLKLIGRNFSKQEIERITRANCLTQAQLNTLLGDPKRRKPGRRTFKTN
jgi:hypothetical protein